jgi:putative peptidoglycan lipid II flippase
MIFSALFIIPLAHAGLALASSLAAWLNIAMLAWYLQKHQIYQIQAGWGTFLTRVLVSNALLSFTLWYGSDDLSLWFSWHWYQRFIHLFGLLFIGMIVYLGCLWLSGMRLEDLKVQGANL